MENRLTKLLCSVDELNVESMRKSKQRWDGIAKPLNSLGLLEDAVVQIAGIQQTEQVDVSKRCTVVMCADNGVVCEGVTQTSSDVTKAVAVNMTHGNTCVCNMSKVASSDVFVVDVGIMSDVSVEEQGNNKIIDKKVRYGTANLAVEPAMTREECVKAIFVGIDMVAKLKEDGYKIIATGEMGIGNTTTSSAVASVLTDALVEKVTGKGSGLSSESLKLKVNAIKRGIALNKPDKNDVIDVVSKVGGLDIAALLGVFLGGAIYKIPIVVDGFISSVSALSAIMMCEKAKDYMLVSHVSNEPAGKMLVEALGKKAFLTCNMCLGEGTGAVLDFLLLDSALSVYNNMSTFESANIEQYVPLD